jgi:hypothetical protein
MKTITLAIPFYNTSKYFLDAIQYAVDDNFVSEISITDDCSTDAEWEKLNSIISTLDTNKIKVYRNDENLKPFRNKYNAVMNSTNEWVYLLDSDNHMLENSIELLKTIPDDDPNMVYSPQHLCCKNDGFKDYEVVSDYNFKHEEIGIEETKDILFKKHKWARWFVNSGNYVVNRERYLKSLAEPYQDKTTELLHADTAAAYYFLLRDGVKFKVVEGLKHYHRLRKDSTWNACGQYSQQSVDYYTNKIINLYE